MINYLSKYKNTDSIQIEETRRKVGVFFFLIQLVLFCSFPVSSLAQNKDPVEEYPAKAALIYNFAKFVTWPKSTFDKDESIFTIGLFGENTLGDSLKEISNKMIHGKRIRVYHFSSISDFRPCQVLFTSSEFLVRFERLNPGLLEKLNVLTVGEDDDFLKANGILLITIIDNHLAFKINLKSAKLSKIRIRANLLALAADVHGR